MVLLFIASSLCLSKYSTEGAQANDNGQSKAPDSSTPASTTEELEKLLSQNKILLEEKKSFEDKYKRALAEGENVRRRMLRQVEEAKLFGIQSFCKDLLEVADILEKATDSAPADQLKDGVNPHLVQMFEGLKMTNAQLLKVNLHYLVFLLFILRFLANFNNMELAALNVLLSLE